MYAALPRPEYYDGAAPPAPSAGVAPIPAPPLRSRGGTWSARGWFPRSLSSDQRVRHPALPLRHRHGYAVDLHRGLQTQAKQTQPEVPLPLAAGRVRTANQPESTGFRAGIRSRGVTTADFSRVPSRLAHRARPIRQCRDDATSSRLLPPSPPTRGLGCLQLHPAATTAEPWRSHTSIRTNSASWRTFLAYTFPSRSPRPAHPAVPGRHDFVEAAPALPGDPRIGLPPAPARCCDSEPMDGLSPPYGQTAPRGAHTKPTQLRVREASNTPGNTNKTALSGTLWRQC